MSVKMDLPAFETKVSTRRRVPCPWNVKSSLMLVPSKSGPWAQEHLGPSQVSPPHRRCARCLRPPLTRSCETMRVAESPGAEGEPQALAKKRFVFHMALDQLLALPLSHATTKRPSGDIASAGALCPSRGRVSMA